MTCRIGVSLMPLGIDRETLVEAAVLADQLGYNLVSTTEGWTYDGTILLAEIAQKTRQIRLCSSILSVYGRSAGTMAMAAATLQNISHGRYILGMGASTSALTEGFHDQDYSTPFSQLKHHLRHVRALLSGERAPVEGRSTKPLRLGLTTPPTPIWIGGLGRRARNLTAREADGWLPVMTPAATLRAQRDEMLRHRQRDDLEIAPTVMVVVRDSEDAALREAAKWVTRYATGMGEFYPRHLRSLGYGEAVDALHKSPGDPDNQAVRELVDDLSVFGTPDTARERFVTWAGDGIDIPKVGIQPRSTRQQIMTTIEALAPEGSRQDL